MNPLILSDYIQSWFQVNFVVFNLTVQPDKIAIVKKFNFMYGIWPMVHTVVQCTHFTYILRLILLLNNVFPEMP